MSGRYDQGLQTHPARFSKKVIAAIDKYLPAGSAIHDPWAGTGQRLGELADKRGAVFTGTELEDCFILDHRVVQGNSIDRETYPLHPHVIVTAPCLPNSVSRNCKTMKTYTYRAHKMARMGPEAGLGLDNMGRYYYHYNSYGSNFSKYWDIAEKSVKQWKAPLAIVSLSDYTQEKKFVAFSNTWTDLMLIVGYPYVECTVTKKTKTKTERVCLYRKAG